MNGTRGLLNNFILDGVDNNSNDVGTNVLKTNVDAIAEFKVQTSNYSAEFGRSGGAVINATIKSGTNQFHGNVFEFLRNDVLDARGFFEPSGDKKAPFRQNQFGSTLGGPIIRDKLSFFMDYQGTRIGTSQTEFDGADAAEFGGDFSVFDSTIYDPDTTDRERPGGPYTFPGKHYSRRSLRSDRQEHPVRPYPAPTNPGHPKLRQQTIRAATISTRAMRASITSSTPSQQSSGADR